MKRLRRHKCKFIQQVSEMNPNKDIIEEIMALENEQERLYNSKQYYRYSNSISAGLSNFFNSKIEGKLLGVINAMALQTEKNKSNLISILKRYIDKIEKVKLPKEKYKDLLEFEPEQFSQSSIEQYIESEKNTNSWDYDAFLRSGEVRDDGTPYMSDEAKEKLANSKIALEI